MANKWGNGKATEQVVKGIANHTEAILNGTVLAIDPASRSLGYALFSQTKLVEKGTIQSKKRDINLRLQDISKQLTDKFQDIDLMAVEKIRGSMAHDYLRWSIGMAIAAIGARELIEVPITFWKKLIDTTYEKTDANDAEMIGKVVILIAEDAGGEGQSKSRGKRKRVGHGKKAQGRKQKVKAAGAKTKGRSCKHR